MQPTLSSQNFQSLLWRGDVESFVGLHISRLILTQATTTIQVEKRVLSLILQTIYCQIPQVQVTVVLV